ncbi:hypothetical protein [Desulfatirhabdium butyrativorans]|uniref:hypothetical protein n=1 Tax=Desulfatirhabdium butyrativorans TaxID=340467 RepID=UPI00054FDD0E|nr:hypothetical protein [Desulfatirhabdium butyrativorans]
MVRLWNRMWMPLCRWMGWWVGLFTLNTNCPCCGQPLCPNAALGAGLLAALLTCCLQGRKWMLQIWNGVARRRIP